MNDSFAWAPVGTRVIDALVGHELATSALTDLSEALLYNLVADAAREVSSEPWTSEPGRSDPWEARVSPAVAERLALAVSVGAAARWWSGGVSDRPQVWLGPLADAPTASVLAPPVDGKPQTEIWTSSAVQGMPSAWWPVVQSGITCRAGALSIWQLNLHPGVRVFDIREPEDWRWLCDTFPGPAVHRWVVPDWAAAREQFDGIHLTVDGLIHVQGLEIETDNGPAKLEHWDAESTAWLRWPVASVERLGSIRDPTHSQEITRSRIFRRPRRR